MDRLAHAVAEGGKLSTLLEGIKKHEDQRTRLCTELTMLDSLSMTPFDPARVEHELRGYLADWPSLAQAHPAQTRQILRKLLPSRIRVWRVLRGSQKSYHFEGEAALGKLFNGLINIERSGVPNGEFKWGHADIYLPNRSLRYGYTISRGYSAFRAALD